MHEGLIVCKRLQGRPKLGLKALARLQNEAREPRLRSWGRLAGQQLLVPSPPASGMRLLQTHSDGKYVQKASKRTDLCPCQRELALLMQQRRHQLAVDIQLLEGCFDQVPAAGIISLRLQVPTSP